MTVSKPTTIRQQMAYDLYGLAVCAALDGDARKQVYAAATDVLTLRGSVEDAQQVRLGAIQSVIADMRAGRTLGLSAETIKSRAGLEAEFQTIAPQWRQGNLDVGTESLLAGAVSALTLFQHETPDQVHALRPFTAKPRVARPAPEGGALHEFGDDILGMLGNP